MLDPFPFFYHYDVEGEDSSISLARCGSRNYQITGCILGPGSLLNCWLNHHKLFKVGSGTISLCLYFTENAIQIIVLITVKRKTFHGAREEKIKRYIYIYIKRERDRERKIGDIFNPGQYDYYIDNRYNITLRITQR